MFTKYFTDLEKRIIKKGKPAKGATEKSAKKGAAKAKTGAAEITLDKGAFADSLNRIVPSKLKVEAARPIDMSGFSPEGSDLIAYREYCRDIVNVMNGYVPSELVYGTYFIENRLDRKSLEGVVNRVSVVKKLNQFAEKTAESSMIPAFVIAVNSGYSVLEMKNDLINYYMSNSIPNENELDILVLWDKGILVKNWREKRSYVGLETNEDTLIWFFILMNEYLEAEKEHEIDFRSYVKKNTVYTQY